MTSKRRVAASALITAPFIVFAATATLAFVAGVVVGDSWLSSILFFAVPIICAFNAAITWTLGLAWHALMMRLTPNPSLDLYALPGGLFGWLILRGLVAFLSPNSTHDAISAPANPVSELYVHAVGAFFGATTASIFWLLRRPDRDAPNPPTSPP